MDGFINLIKPPGMTSHDVVAYVRRLLGIRKVGHTGTLDPGAAGLLLLGLGKATRLFQYLRDDKEYRAEITFGLKTDTGDIYGETQYAADASDLTEGRVRSALGDFTGVIYQVPPMTSALRHKGRKLYELARMGQVVEREPRKVVIHSLVLVRTLGWGSPRPRVYIDVRCSSGTYIRTLCSDLGDKLGCGAHMSFLLRTGVGDFDINNSLTLEELARVSGGPGKESCFTKLYEALHHIPMVMVYDEAVRSVKAGNTLFLPGVKDMPGELEEGQLVRLHGQEGLLAVARVIRNARDSRLQFQPEKVLA